MAKKIPEQPAIQTADPALRGTLAEHAVLINRSAHTSMHTVKPTVSDDSSDGKGYSVGDVWLDTTNDDIYDCIDSTVGAAIWLRRWLHSLQDGAILNLESSQAVGTLSSGATITLSNLIPAASLLQAVSARVTTAITGPTSWLLGVSGDTNQWGDTLALTKDTTVDYSDYTGTKPPEFFAAATSVLITRGSASDFTAGAVRVVVHYFTVTAPTA